MKRRYRRSAANFAQALEALRMGATIVTPKYDIGNPHQSLGAFFGDGSPRSLPSTQVAHSAVVALHNRKLLIVVEDGKFSVTWKLDTGIHLAHKVECDFRDSNGRLACSCSRGQEAK